MTFLTRNFCQFMQGLVTAKLVILVHCKCPPQPSLVCTSSPHSIHGCAHHHPTLCCAYIITPFCLCCVYHHPTLYCVHHHPRSVLHISSPHSVCVVYIITPLCLCCVHHHPTVCVVYLTNPTLLCTSSPYSVVDKDYLNSIG